MEVDQDLATCYHEAAHAVFAVRVCGGGVRYVDADERYCAARLSVVGDYAESWRRALYTLAGRFAEQHGVWGEIVPDAWTDFRDEAAMQHAGELNRGDALELMELLYEMGEPAEQYSIVVCDTESEVRCLWPEIAAVAQALRARRRMDGGEVEALLAS